MDGRRYHHHANHLRPYFVQVDSVECSALQLHQGMNNSEFAEMNAKTCSIVYEKDVKFGDIGGGDVVDKGELTPAPLPSALIKDEIFGHLAPTAYF